MSTAGGELVADGDLGQLLAEVMKIKRLESFMQRPNADSVHPWSIDGGLGSILGSLVLVEPEWSRYPRLTLASFVPPASKTLQRHHLLVCSMDSKCSRSTSNRRISKLYELLANYWYKNRSGPLDPIQSTANPFIILLWLPKAVLVLTLAIDFLFSGEEIPDFWSPLCVCRNVSQPHLLSAWF